MLTRAQVKFIHSSLQTPWESLIVYFYKNEIVGKLDDLLDIIQKSEPTDEQLEKFISSLVKKDEAAMAIKSAKEMRDIYYLKIQKNNLAQLGNEEIELKTWQSSVLTYLTTQEESFLETLEKEKVQQKKEKEEEYKSKKESAQELKEEEKPSEKSHEIVKDTLFQAYEIVHFAENEKVALAAINEPANAIRFTPDQLFAIAQKHTSFALAVCNNFKLHNKLTKEQFLKLAEIHADVTLFLAEHYEKLGIEISIINHLVFDNHYENVKQNEKLLNYFVNLAIYKVQYNNLNKAYKTKLLEQHCLAAYAFANQKAFNESDDKLFVELLISHILKNQRDINPDQIGLILQNERIVAAITSEQLHKFVTGLSSKAASVVLKQIDDNRKLSQIISTQSLLALISDRSQRDLDENTIIKLLNQKGFLDQIDDIFRYETQFVSIIRLIKNTNSKAIEEKILKAVQSRGNRFNSWQLGILAENFEEIGKYIKDNLLLQMDINYLSNLKAESLTEAQRENLIKNLQNIGVVISLALSSPLYAMAVIKTGKYSKYSNIDAALKVLFNKYPDVKEYAFQHVTFNSSESPEIAKMQKQYKAEKPNPKQNVKSPKKQEMKLWQQSVKKYEENSNKEENKNVNVKETNSSDYHYLFKVILAGDSGVGKSCFLLRYVDGIYTESYLATIGLYFKIRTTDIQGEKVKLQMWDTRGQERFRSIDSMSQCVRGVEAAILFFDLTDRISFYNLQEYYNKIVTLGNPIVILVGTKSDLINKRVIERNEACEYAKSLGILYFETSAKNNINVEEVFSAAAKILVQKKLSEKEEKPSVKPSWSPTIFAQSKNIQNIQEMNTKFENIYKSREACHDKHKAEMDLIGLRKKALDFIKKDKENYKDKSSKISYLETVRKLAIFQNHLYEGFGASIKNVGRTNALIKIDKWINEVRKENIPEINYENDDWVILDSNSMKKK